MDILNALFYMLNEMSPYILLGLLVAGLMHSFIPAGTMSRHLSGTGWKPVIKAALIGVPLPLCSCGVLPAAVAMKRSGASNAASSSFLIATPQTGWTALPRPIPCWARRLPLSVQSPHLPLPLPEGTWWEGMKMPITGLHALSHRLQIPISRLLLCHAWVMPCDMAS